MALRLPPPVFDINKEKTKHIFIFTKYILYLFRGFVLEITKKHQRDISVFMLELNWQCLVEESNEQMIRFSDHELC